MGSCNGQVTVRLGQETFTVTRDPAAAKAVMASQSRSTTFWFTKEGWAAAKAELGL